MFQSASPTFSTLYVIFPSPASNVASPGAVTAFSQPARLPSSLISNSEFVIRFLPTGTSISGAEVFSRTILSIQILCWSVIAEPFSPPAPSAILKILSSSVSQAIWNVFETVIYFWSAWSYASSFTVSWTYGVQSSAPVLSLCVLPSLCIAYWTVLDTELFISNESLYHCPFSSLILFCLSCIFQFWSPEFFIVKSAALSSFWLSTTDSASALLSIYTSYPAKSAEKFPLRRSESCIIFTLSNRTSPLLPKSMLIELSVTSSPVSNL